MSIYQHGQLSSYIVLYLLDSLHIRGFVVVVVVDRNDDDKTLVASSHDDFVFPNNNTDISR